MAERPTMLPWTRRPLYKYGMLAVITSLGLLHLWTLLLDGPGTAYGATIGLVVVGMLLMNNIVLTFLDESRRRRVMPVQMVLNLGGLAYVALRLWQDVVR